MLPKKKRLKRSEFNRFFSIGKKKNISPFTVVYSPLPTFHASVVVSKKIERKAVGRNKLRRQIYDMVRRRQKETGASGVYIFVVKPEVKKFSYQTLKEAVDTIVA
jgi:ribonuclease P protein component